MKYCLFANYRCVCCNNYVLKHAYHTIREEDDKLNKKCEKLNLDKVQFTGNYGVRHRFASLHKKYMQG